MHIWIQCTDGHMSEYTYVSTAKSHCVYFMYLATMNHYSVMIHYQICIYSMKLPLTSMAKRLEKIHV